MMRRAVLWLFMLGLGLATVLAFAGSVFDPPVNAEYRKPAAVVVWIETDEIRAICGPRALACARPGEPCTIWTYPNPAFDTLGHELLHCFKGYWHPRKDET